jgi:hypothetical protein
MKTRMIVTVLLILAVIPAAVAAQSSVETGGVGSPTKKSPGAGIGGGTGIAPGTLQPVHAQAPQYGSSQTAQSPRQTPASSGGIHD